MKNGVYLFNTKPIILILKNVDGESTFVGGKVTTDSRQLHSSATTKRTGKKASQAE